MNLCCSAPAALNPDRCWARVVVPVPSIDWDMCFFGGTEYSPLSHSSRKLALKSQWWGCESFTGRNDGWFPIYVDPNSAEGRDRVDYAANIASLGEAWARAGRSGTPDLSVFGVGPDQGAAESLIELGFNRVIFGLPSAEKDTVGPMLDRYAKIVSAIEG